MGESGPRWALGSPGGSDLPSQTFSGCPSPFCTPTRFQDESGSTSRVPKRCSQFAFHHNFKPLYPCTICSLFAFKNGGNIPPVFKEQPSYFCPLAPSAIPPSHHVLVSPPPLGPETPLSLQDAPTSPHTCSGSLFYGKKTKSSLILPPSPTSLSAYSHFSILLHSKPFKKNLKFI